jgi:hypothetical protein
VTIPIGTSITEAAAQAAACGWRVFPCRPGDKRPAVSDWEHRACADPARVEQAFRGRWAGCNYGVACGPSGLVVVDLDRDEAKDGRAEFVALCKARGLEQPPQVLMIRTPRGGVHLYFAALPGREIRNSASRIGPGIDVRGRGGYVVGPGSVIDGRPYAVIASLPVLPLPGWLADLADPAPEPVLRIWPSAVSGRVRPRLVGIIDQVLTAPIGERNTMLYWAACRCGEMVAAGKLSMGVVELALAEAAEGAGLDEREADRTIRSALARTAGAT